ncbi:MAG: hypothetical protein A3K18_05700 [Lentisphaerae bacterium RIFOXYA12_64_32]|nr:MAG: hypothetical protein A3K18_05700 [Lentisphaerae bacterium RIFOXYA12_64_32]
MGSFSAERLMDRSSDRSDFWSCLAASDLRAMPAVLVIRGACPDLPGDETAIHVIQVARNPASALV